MKCIYLQILEHNASDSPPVLAVVTGTSGSTPRKPCSAALFNQAGLLLGTIGGGIVEKKVEQIARDASISGLSGVFNFELNNDISIEEEAVCGGKMNILIDANPAIHLRVFEQIRQSLSEGSSGVLITRITEKSDRTVTVDRFWDNGKGNRKEFFKETVETKIKALITNVKGNSSFEFYPTPVSQNEDIFLELIVPPPKLIIAGAGHIGKALAHLGKLMDFDVTVIDDRMEFANTNLIPDADIIIVDDVGHAIEKLKKNKDTYIVIVTRGHKNDADALKSSLASEVAYIGMIGSTKKIALIRKKSIDEGWATAQQWTKIHAPIGLPIQSESVQEIAISIAAELISIRNQKKAIHG